MELADITDLKSVGGNTVPVQVRSAAPKIDILRQKDVDFYFFTLHFSLKSRVDFWKVINYNEQ